MPAGLNVHFFPINILWQPRIAVLTGAGPSVRSAPRASERLAGPSEVEEFAGEIHIPRDSRSVGVQLVNNVLHRVSVNAKNISATSRRRQVDELLLMIFFDPRRFKISFRFRGCSRSTQAIPRRVASQAAYGEGA